MVNTCFAAAHKGTTNLLHTSPSKRWPYWVGDTCILTPSPAQITGHPSRMKITGLTCARCGRYSLHGRPSGEAILGFLIHITIWQPGIYPKPCTGSILRTTPPVLASKITRICNVGSWQWFHYVGLLLTRWATTNTDDNLHIVLMTCSTVSVRQPVPVPCRRC